MEDIFGEKNYKNLFAQKDPNFLNIQSENDLFGTKNKLEGANKKENTEFFKPLKQESLVWGVNFKNDENKPNKLVLLNSQNKIDNILYTDFDKPSKENLNVFDEKNNKLNFLRRSLAFIENFQKSLQKIPSIQEFNEKNPVAKQEPKTKSKCNCKKTKCLKLYCDCFASNGMCGPECNCSGCHNIPEL